MITNRYGEKIIPTENQRAQRRIEDRAFVDPEQNEPQCSEDERVVVLFMLLNEMDSHAHASVEGRKFAEIFRRDPWQAGFED